MRLSQPRRATQLKIQASSACCGNLALIEHDVLLRIDAGGEERSRHLAGVVLQLARVLPDRDGVQVDDAEQAIVVVLQLHEALDGAEIVAEMEIAGRLDAGKNARDGRVHHCRILKGGGAIAPFAGEVNFAASGELGRLAPEHRPQNDDQQQAARQASETRWCRGR